MCELSCKIRGNHVVVVVVIICLFVCLFVSACCFVVVLHICIWVYVLFFLSKFSTYEKLLPCFYI